MDKREAILQAALTLIAQNGFHNAPMSQIAKEAHVASGSIYIYFENKQALIDELFTQIKIEMNDFILKGYKKGTDIHEKLYLTWRHLLDYYLTNPMQVRFLNQYAYSSYISEELICSNMQLFDCYTEMVQSAIGQGLFKELPMHVILAYVVGPIKELQYQHEVENIQIDETVKKKMFAVLLDGLKA